DRSGRLISRISRISRIIVMVIGLIGRIIVLVIGRIVVVIGGFFARKMGWQVYLSLLFFVGDFAVTITTNEDRNDACYDCFFADSADGPCPCRQDAIA
ncbi:MAG TPA: hypothetical protein PLE35_11695, partial [Lentisphaeria bacterium]|nr:hypothetical protein [Lentisphaeria bacterium]